MPYGLIYHPDVKRVDLPRIDEKNRQIIRRAIEVRLTTNPALYGKPLRRTLKGYWKLRVGDYRVVFKPSGEEILILAVIHRKDVYSEVLRRANG
jgi:mRNA interferase RelE/StbE